MKKNILKTIVLVSTTLCLISCGSNKSMTVTPPVSNPVVTNDPTQPVMPAGEQILLTFCMDEAYDKPGVYMGGLGIVEGRPDRSTAILDANRVAIADIASRYVGIITSAMNEYSKDTNVPMGKKIYESSLEGGVESIGRKVVDKYASVACRKLAQSATGGYVGYVAVQIMLDEAKKGLAEELEVRKVDYDKEKFFKKVDEKLAAGSNNTKH